MKVPDAGYREVEHTADWALQVWGPDLPALFALAAEGMNVLSGIVLEEERVTRKVELEAGDLEILLVAFLDELLYFGEQEGIGFDQYTIEINENHLSAQLEGGPFLERKKEIKAVTFHNMAIKKIETGFWVEVVFDV
ncbi:archease [Chloroflexota bacterium]